MQKLKSKSKRTREVPWAGPFAINPPTLLQPQHQTFSNLNTNPDSLPWGSPHTAYIGFPILTKPSMNPTTPPPTTYVRTDDRAEMDRWMNRRMNALRRRWRIIPCIHSFPWRLLWIEQSE